MKRSMISLIPLAILLVGAVFVGGYMLGNAMSAQAANPAQEGIVEGGPQDPFFTGTGWVVKPFQKVLLERWTNLGPTDGGNCVRYRAASPDQDAPSFAVVASRLGQLGVRHDYALDSEVWVCGNTIHLPPTEAPPVGLQTVFDDDDS